MTDIDPGPGARLLGLGGVPLVLASRSPRRRELLERLGIPLIVLPSGVREGDRHQSESPSAYVRRLAVAKAEAVAAETKRAGAYACLGADTVVEVDGAVLEQPRDRADAVRLLNLIGGRWHTVWTGLALSIPARGAAGSEVEDSRVFFERMGPAELEAYLDTGEGLDKAGAYGIQGWGGIFVSRIEGDYFNVMGLPLAALRRLCRRLEGESRA